MHSTSSTAPTEISGANGGLPYCPNMAGLKPDGIDYLFAYTSQPSDSFPRVDGPDGRRVSASVGALYDDAYDRLLDPPAVTTGDGLAAGTCLPYAEPSATTTEYDEGIDLNQMRLNGGAPAGVDGGIQSIDPKRLVRDPAKGCAPRFILELRSDQYYFWRGACRGEADAGAKDKGRGACKTGDHTNRD